MVVDLLCIIMRNPEKLRRLIFGKKRRQLRRLRLELQSSLGEALRKGLDRDKWQDPEAWREHTKQYREAVKKARERFEAERKGVLSAEQFQRLQEIEAAAERYRRRLQQARRETYGRLHRLLKGQEKVVDLSEPAGPEPPGAPDP